MDAFINSLAGVDKNIAEVSTNIKLFMDKGSVSKIAIHIQWNAESRFFILDENMNILSQESHGPFSKVHPVLDDIVDKFLCQSISLRKQVALEDSKVDTSKTGMFAKALANLRGLNAT